jgi:YcxB-like protein
VEAQNTVELNGTIRFDELTRVVYFCTLSRQGLVAAVFVVAMILLASPVSDWASVQKDIWMIPLLIYFVVVGVAPYWKLRNAFASQSYMRESVTYVFGPETVARTSASLSWDVRWNVIKRIQETKSFFLLYQGKAAIVVPKRFFQSPDQMESWRQLAVECVATSRIEKAGVLGGLC